MPKKIENALKRSAAKKGLSPKNRRYGAYVFGTLNKLKRKGPKKAR